MFVLESGDESTTVKPSTLSVHGDEPVASRENSSTSSARSTPTTGIVTASTQSVHLSRRVLPVLEAEADVCSICLDAFCLEDPGAKTRCGCVS